MKNFTDIHFQNKKLLNLIKEFKDKSKIIRALKIAKEAHKGQERDEGGDYFIHPVRIANSLINELSVKDTDLIIAGVLHDVIEDSNITLSYIKQSFGKKIAFLVKKLTRNKKQETKKEKYLNLMKESEEIRLLKSVDWLDNLRSFPYRKKKDKRFYRHLREASEMYLPLAKSINPHIASEMRGIIEELQKINNNK